MPIGKSPVGKSPIGKTPIAARLLIQVASHLASLVAAKGRSVVTGPKTPRSKTLGLCLVAGLAFAVSLSCDLRSASASETEARSGSDRLVSLWREVQERVASVNPLVPGETPNDSKSAPHSDQKLTAGLAKAPYYVDFRARTAASWGHAFVWYGKTSERQVEVAGLTPMATRSLMSLVT